MNKILGHCNESDIKKFSHLSNAMKIKMNPNYTLHWDIYIRGKISIDRNKILNRKATKILALVHTDLAGPIKPLGKEGYRYVLNFINDFQAL